MNIALRTLLSSYSRTSYNISQASMIGREGPAHCGDINNICYARSPAIEI